MSEHDSVPASESPPLPEITVESTARSFFNEAKEYGFRRLDFVKLVSAFMDLVLAEKEGQGIARDARSRFVKDEHLALPIQGQKCTLRALGEPGDRELLEGWLADRSGRHFLLSTASGRIRDVAELLGSPVNHVALIVYQGRPVGCVAYLDHNRDQHRAEIRKLIGVSEMRGRGLAREAAELWVGYGIGVLGLKKIYLNTLRTDINNIRINEELGFRLEGILRNEVLIDGEHRDVLRMGLWHG